MGFLDKVKDTAKQVGDKAQEVGAKGKDKLEDHKLGKQIEEYKQEIGTIVYGQKTGGDVGGGDARIDELVGLITKTAAEITSDGPAASAPAADATPEG
jgi:hypothetical protein